MGQFEEIGRVAGLAILEAPSIHDAATRSRGDAERGLMIFDTEPEMIRQDQALEQLISIVRGIGDENLEDHTVYPSVEDSSP